MQNEKEISRDIPLLRQKIDRCSRSIVDLQSAMIGEQGKILELDLLIRDEQGRAEGKRPRYDVVSLQENIERHKRNILTFTETIGKENETIAKVQRIISVLEEDLKRPTEVVLDMRKTTQRG